MKFWDDLDNRGVAAGEIALWWLGQAGFLIKTHGGKRILIDPYLSDYVNRLLSIEEGQNYRRMTPMWIEPERLEPDILLSSHEHPDHLDIDAIPLLLGNGCMQGFVNGPSMDELKKNGISTDRFQVVRKGDEINLNEFHLTITDCDHGKQCPEALGFYLDFGFLTIYYSGDTGFNLDRLHGVIEKGADVVLLPVNGAYGNLNAREASKLAAALNAKVCIPMHFWTFPAHAAQDGAPGDALREFPSHAPGCDLYLATPGETIIFGQDGKRC